jgi:hypothetical protein
MSDLSLQVPGASPRELGRSVAAATAHLRALRVLPAEAAIGRDLVMAWSDRGCPVDERPSARMFRWNRAWDGALREARRMLARDEVFEEPTMTVKPEVVQSYRTAHAERLSKEIADRAAADADALEWGRRFFMHWSQVLREPSDAQNILDWAYELFRTHGTRAPEEVAQEEWHASVAREQARDPNWQPGPRQ